MGAHEEFHELSEVTRAEVRDDWVVTRCVSRTAQKFGLSNKQVKQIIYDAAVFASLPENVKTDIASEVRRLQMMMGRYWPDAMNGDKKAAELWRKLGVDLRLLTGWQAPASSGFHLSVNVAQVTSGSAKLEELLNSLMALPAPLSNEVGSEVDEQSDEAN
jgi:hypothetical protein